MVSSNQIREWEFATKADYQTDKVPIPTVTVETNPKIVKNGLVLSEHSAASGSLTVVSASAGITTRGDIYITCIHYAVIKDAACDVATGTINITATSSELGVVLNLVKIPVITATAQSITGTINLSHPIKISRNTAMLFSGTYTAGVMVRSVTITYFVDETAY